MRPPQAVNAPEAIEEAITAKRALVGTMPIKTVYREITRTFYRPEALVRKLEDGTARVRRDSVRGGTTVSKELIEPFSEEYQLAYADFVSQYTIVTSGTLVYVEQAWPVEGERTHRYVFFYDGKDTKYFTWFRHPETGRVSQTGKMYKDRNAVAVSMFTPQKAYGGHVKRFANNIAENDGATVLVKLAETHQMTLSKADGYMTRRIESRVRDGKNVEQFEGAVEVAGLRLPAKSSVTVLDHNGKPRSILMRDHVYQALSEDEAKRMLNFEFPEGTGVVIE